MILEEHNAEVIIESYGYEEFQPLFVLNKRLEEEGASNDIANEMLKTCLELPIQVSFNWKAWEEGRSALMQSSFNNKNNYFLCKLLTMIIRLDRFVEGNFEGEVYNGNVSKIIGVIDANLTSRKRKNRFNSTNCPGDAIE